MQIYPVNLLLSRFALSYIPYANTGHALKHANLASFHLLVLSEQHALMFNSHRIGTFRVKSYSLTAHLALEQITFLTS